MKETFAGNQFDNILRLLDDLPNFPFNAGETMGDYYLLIWYIQADSRVVKRVKI